MSRFIIAALWAAALAASAFAAAAAFPHEGSDLKPDPAIRFGALPNGLRYAVRANAEPKGRASLRLMVMAGSLHEEEDQRGLAHFVEHMAFNGTRRFPHETLVKYFQRLGMEVGDNASATVHYDRTRYLIDLPDNHLESIDGAFGLLLDFAEGIVFDEADIERERGVLLAEMRTRDTIETRQWQMLNGFILGDGLVHRRYPIGEASVLKTAPRQRLVDFYDAWYRPERLVVVAVGDFDARAVEKRLRTAFARLRARAPARPEPNLGPLPKPAAGNPAILYRRESELCPTHLVSVTRPADKGPDTLEARKRRLVRDLAIHMLNFRLSVLAKRPNSPFTGADLSYEAAYRHYEEARLSVTCYASKYEAALTAALVEVRRAYEEGFQAEELRMSGAVLTGEMRRTAREASTRRSPELADRIAEAIVDGIVVVDPELDLRLFAAALAAVTVEDCRKTLADLWLLGGRFVCLTGDVEVEGDVEDVLGRAHAAAGTLELSPSEKLVNPVFGYTDFGAPGRVEARTTVADLGIVQVRFANGVRLNIKRTDFEAHSIEVGLCVGEGCLQEFRSMRGICPLACGMLVKGGLAKHPLEVLQRLMAGRRVHFDCTPDDDHIRLRGTTTEEDLGVYFNLLAAVLTDAAFRPDSLSDMGGLVQSTYLGLAHDIDAPLQMDIPRLLTGGDVRFGRPPLERMLSFTPDDLRRFIAPQFLTGELEVSLVGDLDVEACIREAARTLGALPRRIPRRALLPSRPVNLAPPLERSFEVDTKTPTGVVALFWPTTDASEARKTRRFELLARILGNRVSERVREEMGEAYYVHAVNGASECFDGYGHLSVYIPVDPAKAQSVVDSVLAIARALQENGVTEDELRRAREPMLVALRADRRTNAHWLDSVLFRCQEKPAWLEHCRSHESDLETTGTADLAALARSHLGPEKAFRFIMRPSGVR